MTPRNEPHSSSHSHSHLRMDPRNYRIDALFFQRLFNLCRPYWLRKGSYRSWLILGILLALGAGITLFSGYISALVASRTNALVAKDGSRFWFLFAVVYSLYAATFCVTQLQKYLGSWLNIDWRKWLSIHLIDRYLQHRTYYEITVDQDIDNPDQRIQEQVPPFCAAMSDLPQKLVTSTAGIGVQFFILMSISKAMLIATFAYVALTTALTYFVYRPTIRQNWDSTVAEADFRYGLLHVRDNAETVAFYGGEASERHHLVQRLTTAVKTQLRLLRYGMVIDGIGEISQLAWGALPFLLVAPLVIKGALDYGKIDQAIIAASLLMNSLSVVLKFLPDLSRTVPMTVRLAEIQEKFAALSHVRTDAAARGSIVHEFGSHVALDEVSVQTPGGEQHLVEKLTCTVAPGSSLVITGQTGVGKSSLLRVLAGLWTRGSGRIVMPPPQDLLFLPQKPYMILGNLRSQLLYPLHAGMLLTDAELQTVLERVNLGDLADRHGGFNVECDWGRILSLGEQQRVAFARFLVRKPRYVFLDEATSGVDPATEALLYGLLRRSDATFISVGHRESLLKHHSHVLNLSLGGGWSIAPTPHCATADD